MRLLLLSLVLANLVALAWWQGWLGGGHDAPGTSGGRPAEIAPERLRVVPLERLDAERAADRPTAAQEPADAAGAGAGGPGGSAAR